MHAQANETVREIKPTEILKDIIRQPYCWPGGYEKAALVDDGGAICSYCCKQEYRNMLHSTRGNYQDGWEVTGLLIVGHDIDSPVRCDHCNREIE